LAARTCSSEPASESVGTAVLDGAGVIGDSIGVADTQCTTMAGTTPGAERFITGAMPTEQEARAAELAAAAAEFVPAPTQGTGPGTWADAVELTTVPAQPPGPSTETGRRLEAMLNPAARAAPARAPSAATTMADRPRAIRHAEAPASVAEQRVAAVAEQRMAAGDLAAVAGVIDRGAVMFLVV
jgi:hypothetical protein